ncbi:hypothetical protein EC991_010640 [Linnemannia zychae]|nr:hypothetical protein EC991_010640 [Linnemannia zychae]
MTNHPLEPLNPQVPDKSTSSTVHSAKKSGISKPTSTHSITKNVMMTKDAPLPPLPPKKDAPLPPLPTEKDAPLPPLPTERDLPLPPLSMEMISTSLIATAALHSNIFSANVSSPLLPIELPKTYDRIDKTPQLAYWY